MILGIQKKNEWAAAGEGALMRAPFLFAITFDKIPNVSVCGLQINFKASMGAC